MTPPAPPPARMTVVTVATFLDAFQKVADLATSSRGACVFVLVRVLVCMRVRAVLAALSTLIGSRQSRVTAVASY